MFLLFKFRHGVEVIVSLQTLFLSVKRTDNARMGVLVLTAFIGLNHLWKFLDERPNKVKKHNV